ncbi:MAG TPA: phospholipase D-like domain-containing protein [Ktedonobacteraceae bacterium]|nr:phospholipase D-like domain-containing protein [Ktedonobacteraceae bacterium]
MNYIPKSLVQTITLFINLLIVAICFALAGCTINISSGGGNTTPCLSNCATGAGVQGVRVYVEPDDGEQVITGAIKGASKSVWLEIYILSDTNVIHALEDAANNGIDVRVMIDPRAIGEQSAATRTIDELKAAGVKAQDTDPDFALTHEKGMIIDGTTAYIMTSNFSRTALGGYSSGTRNREYGIIDNSPQDVQAVIAIFNADWDHTTAQFNDPNLVVSPVNSRSDFTALINSAQHSLLIEAEEMNDSSIEQALVSAARRGVQVEAILPAASSSSGDSNSQGIAAIKQGGVTVREDPQLYMHAKIIIVDGAKAFVGSENISTQSLDQNRELGVIVSDANVLSKLQSTFQTDWGVSQIV